MSLGQVDPCVLNPRDYDRIVLYHTRKAGGTSMRTLMKAVAKWHRMPLEVYEGLIVNDTELLDDRTFFVTHIREPIARVFSMHKFEGSWRRIDPGFPANSTSNSTTCRAKSCEKPQARAIPECARCWAARSFTEWAVGCDGGVPLNNAGDPCSAPDDGAYEPRLRRQAAAAGDREREGGEEEEDLEADDDRTARSVRCRHLLLARRELSRRACRAQPRVAEP